MDFVELHGASGAVYRYRRWPGMASHPPIAGNYAVLPPGSLSPIELGVMENLSLAAHLLGSAAEAELFTRLNVSRAAREEEHSDLARGYPGAICKSGSEKVDDV